MSLSVKVALNLNTTNNKYLTRLGELFFSATPRGIPLPHSNALQYYVKREKCKVNDVIFPSGCEARAINLDNKNMKIGIFAGGTSVRSKNIFTAISRYPTGKYEIMLYFLLIISYFSNEMELHHNSFIDR